MNSSSVCLSSFLLIYSLNIIKLSRYLRLLISNSYVSLSSFYLKEYLKIESYLIYKNTLLCQIALESVKSVAHSSGFETLKERQILGIKSAMARRILKGLTDRNLLIRLGNARATHYKLTYKGGKDE